MSLTMLVAEAEERRIGFVKAATATLSRGGGGGVPYAPSPTTAHPFGDQDMLDAARQYKAARGGWQWTAHRLIAVRVADQPFRCGTKPMRGQAGGPARPPGKKSVGYFDAPAFIRKQMSEGLEQDDNHALLDLFESPNPYMTGWANLYCTALSMQATGLAYWWLENLPKPGIVDSPPRPLRLWYFPATWVKAISDPSGEIPFFAFKVCPPNVPEDKAMYVPGDEMIRFCYPDPANPLGQLSPMQTQARPINTDDEIQKAQFAFMQNGMRPGLVMTVGRLDVPPGMGTGLGPRPILTPEQRAQLTSAARLACAGAMHYGDPFIVDGMIESVTPWTLTSQDLDFPNGSQLTKSRIMQGHGVNPIVAGEVEGANRATSYVAQENVNSGVINPLLTQCSQTLTQKLGPVYESKGNRFYVWLQKAVAHDEDVELGKIDRLLAGEAITKDELREKFDMAPMESGGDEIAAPPKPEPVPPGSTGPTRPGATSSGGGSGKRKPSK